MIQNLTAMKCEIGVVFEVSGIVGVNLFPREQAPTVREEIERSEIRLALLPKSVHKATTPVKDDF